MLKQPAATWAKLNSSQQMEACETIIYRGKAADIFNERFIEATRSEDGFNAMKKEICDGLDAALSGQEAKKLNDSIENIATLLMLTMGWTK